MSILDENEETMARLDVKFDEWQKSGPVLPAPAATGPQPTGDLALPMLG
jgi:hypothetical protein